ncbi:ATP-dependent DNA helicase [Legionella israelensis]|uniref:ATP-dependent DNA helicase n=1 Tax=Legionella israelensis TaxID=454 RepID=UPI0011801A32|nr:ATP-dependent DNA helicase [Legionella israelensis]QDP72052.1 ATP-dependent DNA helicase [Legionella israelensis]
MEINTDLVQSCHRILSDKGRLSTALPGFVSRTAQSELAAAIAQTIEQHSVLVAEAGTGTGKTFAYLIPGLLSGKKVLISTATKTLQDQLFQKDLPILVKALGLSVRMQNLKGRANYICRYRVTLHSAEASFQNPQCIHDILHVKEKLPQLKEGDRSELPELKEDSKAWPYVTSTTENCLGSECPQHSECFLMKARKRAMDADIVVINHHLFFADSRLKKQGFAELLPGFDVVIFDEAHQLPDVATGFYGERVGTRQFRELMDDILKEWPVLDLANQPLKQLSLQAERMFDQMLSVLSTREERVSWQKIRSHQGFMALWEDWLTLKNELSICLQDEQVKEITGIKRCRERLEAIEKVLSSFENEDSHCIRWLERFKHTLVFHSTPYEIANEFGQLLKRQNSAYIFTSATLTMAGAFDSFTKPLGLQNVETLSLPSPFNFRQQALLYLPRTLPDPKDARYHDLLLQKVLPVIDALGGRCFFLFTSHRALKQVAQRMANHLKYPLLVQGDEAKPILLARFRQLGNAVLLGTATFWEGVDVKGEALSCVIIDKLPFASPVDPVVQGKMAYLKARGLSAFDELSLPGAVIALKQGVGRLIRDVEDKGLLIIADPRLTGREYGRLILASLPKLPVTRDEEKVFSFVNELSLKDLKNECISY